MTKLRKKNGIASNSGAMTIVLGMELSNCHMKSWKVARSTGNVEGGTVISCWSFGAEVGRVRALELSASGDFTRSKGVLGELHNVSRGHYQN